MRIGYYLSAWRITRGIEAKEAKGRDERRGKRTKDKR